MAAGNGKQRKKPVVKKQKVAKAKDKIKRDKQGRVA